MVGPFKQRCRVKPPDTRCPVFSHEGVQVNVGLCQRLWIYTKLGRNQKIHIFHSPVLNSERVGRNEEKYFLDSVSFHSTLYPRPREAFVESTNSEDRRISTP